MTRKWLSGIAVLAAVVTAAGLDMATCETLWSIPGSAPGEAKEVWTVNTAMIRRTDDRIFSLVAPD